MTAGRTGQLLVALAVVLALAAAAAAVLTVGRAPRAGDAVGFSPGGGLRDLTDAQLAADLDAVKAAGASWVRVDVDWSVIEQERGQLVWDDVDRVVAAAQERDLEVLGLLAYTPDWARAGCPSDKCPPEDPAGFARFAAAAASRYGTDAVPAWEVWNEPNIPSFWAPEPDARAYTRLFVHAAAAVRRAQPQALVLTGGLAPADGTDETVAPLDFLAQLLDAGAVEVADAVGWHPYSADALPLQPGTEEWNTFLQMEPAHEQLVEAGSARPLWATELGASTARHPRGVDESQQAAILEQAVTHLASERWPWLERMFVYSVRDLEPTPVSEWLNGFGVLRADGTPKPAYDTLRRANALRLNRPVA